MPMDDNLNAERQYAVLEKGKVYPPIMMKPEGTYIHYNESGFMCIVNMTSPTAKEKAAFHSKTPLKIGLFKGNGLLFFVFRFGDLPWQDAPYNPAIGVRPSIPDVQDGKGLSMMILLTDAPRGIIAANPRLVGLTTGFTRELKKAIEECLLMPCAGIEYDMRLNATYNQYSSDDMAREAIAMCDISPSWGRG